MERFERLRSGDQDDRDRQFDQIVGKSSALACFIRERAMRGEVESFCAPLRQVAPGWRRL